MHPCADLTPDFSFHCKVCAARSSLVGILPHRGRRLVDPPATNPDQSKKGIKVQQFELVSLSSLSMDFGIALGCRFAVAFSIQYWHKNCQKQNKPIQHHIQNCPASCLAANLARCEVMLLLPIEEVFDEGEFSSS